MSDPLQRSSEDSPLFGTSHAAGQKAALKVGSWRVKILTYLTERPSCCFEIAAHYGVSDHIISGRFTELARDRYIEPTGQVRRKPQTDCDCEVYRIRAAQPSPIAAIESSYPLSVKIDGDHWDRQELLPNESYPGIPYARRADTGGLRQLVRIELIECPGCAKPLFYIEENGQKKFRCGNSYCAKVWRCRTVSEQGRAAMLALVLETM